MKKRNDYIDPWICSEILRLARKVKNPQKVPITLQGSPHVKKR